MLPARLAPLHVLPLYSLLDPIEQDKVFQPPPAGHRLLIFATNVAETSITIPGIRYVIDCGLEKRRNFDFGRGVIATTVDFISQASAEQRRGRAGRTGPGHCFRLYSSAFFANHFDEFSTPEIQRRPVDEVVLLLKTMGLNEISLFPFPSLVPEASLEQAEQTLMHLSAIEVEKPRPATRIGRMMSVFPVAPRLAKLIVTGRQLGVIDLVVVVAALLSVREPFEGDPAPEFRSERGDVIRLLTAFGAYTFAKDKQQFARQFRVRAKAMEEVAAIREQLVKVIEKVASQSLTEKSRDAVIDPPTDEQEALLTQCIFTAFCDKVARRDDKGSLYTTADGKRAGLHGQSSLSEKKPLWVCYQDIDESQPEKAKLLLPTKISSTWITQLGSKIYLHSKWIGVPDYRADTDAVVGRVEATFGQPNWKLPEAMLPHPEPWRAFAAAFIDGRVVPGLKQFARRTTARTEDLRDNRQLPPRLLMIAVSLKREDIASRKGLQAKWKTDGLFLLTEYLYWLPDKAIQGKVQRGWPFTEELPTIAPGVPESESDSDD
jgi:ATP-dependent RNA helicase DHX37/DHR1